LHFVQDAPSLRTELSAVSAVFRVIGCQKPGFPDAQQSSIIARLSSTQQ
jgi:hypothetical protein